VIDAAIEISGADGGSIELIDPLSSDLKVVARRELSPQIQREAGAPSVQSTPIVTRAGRQIGTLATHHEPRYRPDAHELRLLDLLARQAADIEQQFLAQVGETLQASLDYAATSERIVRLVVGFMGDLCAFDAVEGDGQIRRMKVARGDGATPGAAEALENISPDPGHLLPVLSTRQPLLVSWISSQAAAPDDPYLRALRSVGVRSFMLVPLVARDGVMAVLSIMSCRADRRYDDNDLRLATELARRATLALDNARLYALAQEAIQVRDRVMGVVAHDLRNPLGTILVQAAVVRRRGTDPSGMAMDRIDRAATRMNRLIQDLLDVTRMEGGQLPVQRKHVVPGEILTETLEGQKALAASSSIELAVDVARDLPEVWADHDRLLQVFENLVGNAIKFTEPGGRITIGAAPGQAEVLFSVRDTGSGIAAADIPHLFDRFWQAKREGSEVSRGAGLGLAIVKGIIEAHGGRIWVESASGQGSAFFFTIPAPPRAEAELARLPPPPARSAGARSRD
jgi:signal transduction histidine kinase